MLGKKVIYASLLILLSTQLCGKWAFEEKEKKIEQQEREWENGLEELAKKEKAAVITGYLELLLQGKKTIEVSRLIFSDVERAKLRRYYGSCENCNSLFRQIKETFNEKEKEIVQKIFSHCLQKKNKNFQKSAVCVNFAKQCLEKIKDRVIFKTCNNLASKKLHPKQIKKFIIQQKNHEIKKILDKYPEKEETDGSNMRARAYRVLTCDSCSTDRKQSLQIKRALWKRCNRMSTKKLFDACLKKSGNKFEEIKSCSEIVWLLNEKSINILAFKNIWNNSRKKIESLTEGEFVLKLLRDSLPHWLWWS